MRKNLIIFCIAIFTSIEIYAQIPSGYKRIENNFGVNSIHWDKFETHPSHVLLDSATFFSSDIISVIGEIKSRNFGNKLLGNLLRLKLFSNLAVSYKSAKDEFERKKVEESILNEYKKIEQYIKKKEYVWIGGHLNFSEFNFNEKAFGFQKQLSDLNKQLFDANIEKIDLNWLYFPEYIPFKEVEAEQFVQDNPSREVRAYCLLSQNNYFKFSLEFIVLTYTDRNKEERVIDVYPKIETLNKKFEFLDEIVSNKSVSSIIEETDNALRTEPLDRGGVDKIYKNIRNNDFFRIGALFDKCKKFGFDTSLSEGAKQAIKKYEDNIAQRKKVLDNILKVGRQFNGYQIYAGDIKKKIVVRIDRKEDWGDNIYSGTCTYSNGKKAIVFFNYNEYDDNLGINITFYLPTDDELGAGDYHLFYLDNNSLIGFEMNESLDYDRISRTILSLK